MEDVRCRRPDREQALLQPVCLEELLPADHEARAIWEVTGRLDLSGFYAAVAARGEQPGRSATDPRLLLALWLYATKEGVGSGRELERRCRYHDAYRWLCGGVSVNYHTLNDFRVSHGAALDELFTSVLTSLVSQQVVTVERISQDGTRVRAWAGKSSFRRRASLERLQRELAAHVQALKGRVDQPALARTRQLQAAADRQRRIAAALAVLPELEAAKRQQKPKASKENPARASTTDADARVMRLADGGYRPAYNVQVAVDTQSRAIVGVAVTTAGSDTHQSAVLRAQVEARTGGRVQEQLLDGGYANLALITAAERSGVTIYAPVPEPRQKDVDPYAPKPGDSPEVIAWRARMKTAAAQQLYRTRAATVETVNGDLKEHRGLRQFKVRGQAKAFCVALLAALTYNLLHFKEYLLT
jgi:transposase